ncbi:hypothetical protein V3851_05325 [Paenibacillus sp. M1]|uniref:Uncharacterized protein n=1 Tax=Paenibacillus haidiansis TaxID=1574488 RepID=A0ABU7VNC7_9BACL
MTKTTLVSHTAIIGNVYDWVNAEYVVKISAAEAKAVIIAQIEEVFGEAA